MRRSPSRQFLKNLMILRAHLAFKISLIWLGIAVEDGAKNLSFSLDICPKIAIFLTSKVLRIVTPQSGTHIRLKTMRIAYPPPFSQIKGADSMYGNKASSYLEGKIWNTCGRKTGY